MKNVKTLVIVIICAAMCLGYYYYLTQRNSGKEMQMTEAEQIISKDLSLSYPKTAREVVKFYSRIIKCYYEGDYSEEQLGKLAEQARSLMDEELKEQNPQESYLEAVKAEIDEYAKEGKKITNVSLQNTNEITFKEVKGKKCAYVDVTYYVKGEKTSERTNQTFVLRQDENSNWKILGFYQ